MAESQPGVTSPSSASERLAQLRAKRSETKESREREKSAPKPKPKPRATPRTASPTRAIEPGIVHHRIAAGILKGLRERAQEAGLSLDIGELPESATVATVATDDPERLERIIAHLVARVGDRFTFVRKFSRHFEGTERRAGVLSDLTAALFELYRRNPETFEKLARSYGREFVSRQQARKTPAEAAKAAARPFTPQPQPNGGVYAS